MKIVMVNLEFLAFMSRLLWEVAPFFFLLVVEPLRGGGQLKEKADKNMNNYKVWRVLGGGGISIKFFCVSSLSVECFCAT